MKMPDLAAEGTESSGLTAPSALAQNTSPDSKEERMEWVPFEDRKNAGDWRVRSQ